MDKVNTGASIAGLRGKYMFYLLKKLPKCFPKWPQHNAFLISNDGNCSVTLSALGIVRFSKF